MPKAPFSCSFKATGTGTVLCLRTRNSDGATAESIHYTRDGIRPAVSALTRRERREYDTAIQQEWGE